MYEDDRCRTLAQESCMATLPVDTVLVAALEQMATIPPAARAAADQEAR
jgi:hypothetical protein